MHLEGKGQLGYQVSLKEYSVQYKKAITIQHVKRYYFKIFHCNNKTMYYLFPMSTVPESKSTMTIPRYNGFVRKHSNAPNYDLFLPPTD